MGIELARAYIRTRVDNTALSTGFDETRGMVSDALSDIRTYAAGFLAPIAAIGENFLAQGRAAAIFGEDTFTAFQRMLGTAEETKETMDDLTDFAAFTPFEMPQILGVTRELINFGERGDEMMDTLKMLGDASGGTADKFGTLGFVFNQIRGAGKLLSQDFYQLSTRGIINLEDFVKAGIAPTAGAVKEMMSSGKISFDLFRQVLASTTEAGNRNFNAMIEASKTLSGRISTFNDAWNIMGRQVAESLVPFEKFTTEIKIRVVESLLELIKVSDGAAGAAAVGAIKAAKYGAALLAAGVAARIFGISLRTAILGTGVGVAVLALGAAVGMLVNYLSKSEIVIAAVKAASDRLRPAWDNLSAAVSVLGESINILWNAAFGVSLTGAIDRAAEHFAFFIEWFAQKLESGTEKVKWFAEGFGFWIRNGFDLARIAAIDWELDFAKTMGMNDREANEFAAAFYGVFEGLGAFFTAWGENIVAGFKNVVNEFKADLSALAAYGGAILDGKSLGEAWDAATAARDDAMADSEKMVDPFEAYTKARDEAIALAMEGLSEENQGVLAALEREKQKLLEAIARREEAFRNKKEIEEEEDRKKGKGKDKPADDDAAADQGLKAGRYDFKGFGIAIQDAIINRDKDNLGKIATISASSLTIQERILIATQKKNKLGLGP